MSNLDSSNFGSKIYNRFPAKYREDDSLQNYALKRYIEALSDGGFKYAIDEINGLMNLINPVNVDTEVLPILFSQYGLEVFNGIPENYLRYLLPRLGEAWSKKGSISAIEFITSSLSGVKVETEITYDDKGNPFIGINLEMDYSMANYFPKMSQFYRILSNFVPFYCDFGVSYKYVYSDTDSIFYKDSEETIQITKVDEENICISSDLGDRYYPSLNVRSRLLNSSLILNDYSEGVETDYFEDTITYVTS